MLRVLGLKKHFRMDGLSVCRAWPICLLEPSRPAVIESAMVTKRKAKKKAPPLADEKAGYTDLVSADRWRTKPLILLDGTSIEWPSTWKRRDREQWRKSRGLLWSQRKKKTTGA